MNTNTAHAPVDNRALLSTIGHRLVRVVANEPTPYADALFDVLKEERKWWTLEQWGAALNALDTCPHTIAEWLAGEPRRVNPACAHSACSQHYIDSGENVCVQEDEP